MRFRLEICLFPPSGIIIAGGISLYGAIEAGGTKFICGIGTNPDDLKTILIQTTTPEKTLGEAIGFFGDSGEPIRAVGIGSFGPVDLRRGSATFGRITSTPKPGWRDYDIAGAVAGAMRVPVGFDTDVNAAVLGETRWGAAAGLADSLYLTVGSGRHGGGLGSRLHGWSGCVCENGSECSGADEKARRRCDCQRIGSARSCPSGDGTHPDSP